MRAKRGVPGVGARRGRPREPPSGVGGLSLGRGALATTQAAPAPTPTRRTRIAARVARDACRMDAPVRVGSCILDDTEKTARETKTTVWQGNSSRSLARPPTIVCLFSCASQGALPVRVHHACRLPTRAMDSPRRPSDASDSDGPSPYDHVRPRPAPPGADAFLAARLGDCESLTKLIAANPECVLHRDRWDATPLFYASLAGHTRAVHLLLAAGAVADEQSFEGVRAIYAALNADTKALLFAARAVAPPLCPLGSSLAPLAPLLPPGVPCWLAGGGADADAARAAALTPDIAIRLGDGVVARAAARAAWWERCAPTASCCGGPPCFASG